MLPDGGSRETLSTEVKRSAASHEGERARGGRHLVDINRILYWAPVPTPNNQIVCIQNAAPRI